MKKMMRTWVLVAAAAMGLTACQNDIDEQIEVKDSVNVEFIADSADSRTSVDTSGEVPTFAWAETGETFAVLEQTTSLAKATNVTYANEEGKAKITATFDTNNGQAEYKYVTVYPESGYVEAESIDNATLTLHPEQTMYSADSYDHNGDLMVSEVVTTSAQPTEAQMVRFTRLAAVAKMSFKGFGLELGDQVQSVTFTAEGKSIAGTITADLENLVVEGKHAFTVAEGASSVTVTTTSASDVYFTLLPTTLNAGDKYTITVITDKYLYVKQGTIPADKSLAFEAGMVTRFGVDMTGVAPSEKWVLVRDASTLKQGDVVAIAAKDYDKAMSSKLYSNASETSTSARRDATDISKVGNYMFASSNVQSLILVTGTVENTFSFYDEARAKFLVSNNASSRYLINQSYCDANTSFAISIDAETADATIKNIEGDYKNNMIRYYNTSKYFYSGTSTNQAICIYRLEGAVGIIPTIAANVTVPDEDETIVIAEEGAATATAINDVVFNYVGDWAISASAKVKDSEEVAEWLTLTYADGKLNYTAEANNGEVRYATITITASLEGEEPLTWIFNVLQKGAPQEISIAEFITKEVNNNVEYKITGKLTSLASSYSNDSELTDANGNVAKFRYAKVGDEWLVNKDMVKVGDIVTIVAPVTYKGRGGSKDYPATYKGHYRLTTTVEPAIVGYEGGDATISVALEQNGTLGTLCAPTAIEGTMTAEGDFAEFSYTSDATTATVSFAPNAGASRKVETTFKSGLAETSVVVSQQNNPSVKVGWFLVTDVDELQAGDQVILAAKNPDETLDYAFIKQTSSSSASAKGYAITLSGNSIDDVTGVEQFTLESGHADYAETWALKGNSYNKYLYVSSGSLKFKTDLDKHGSWTIAITSDGKATLTSKTSSTSTAKNIMMLNYTTSNQNFAAYASTQTGKGAIYIYKYYE